MNLPADFLYFACFALLAQSGDFLAGCRAFGTALRRSYWRTRSSSNPHMSSEALAKEDLVAIFVPHRRFMP